MSIVSNEAIKKLAKLARIAITEDEVVIYAKHLTAIFSEIETLQEVDTTGVEPLSNVIEQTILMREDIVSDGGYAEDILANAKDSMCNCFVVPKVVE